MNRKEMLERKHCLELKLAGMPNSWPYDGEFGMAQRDAIKRQIALLEEWLKKEPHD